MSSFFFRQSPGYAVILVRSRPTLRGEVPSNKNRPTDAMIRKLLFFGAVLMALVGYLVGYYDAVGQTGPEIKKPLVYQIGRYVHINASGARPLLQAIDALQQKYGWIVDYEDPEYLSAPGTAVNGPTPSHMRHAYAQGSHGDSFSVQFPAAPNSVPDEASVLTTVVDAYDQSDGGAEFKLIKENGARFAVVGVGARGDNGETVSQPPILDTPVTLAKEQRSARETIALICQRVSEAGKVKVSLDVNFTYGETVMVSGVNTPARALLSQTLLTLGGSLYWRLIYEAERKNCGLSIQKLSQ